MENPLPEHSQQSMTARLSHSIAENCAVTDRALQARESRFRFVGQAGRIRRISEPDRNALSYVHGHISRGLGSSFDGDNF